MDENTRSNRRRTDAQSRYDAFGYPLEKETTEIMGAYDDIDGTSVFIIAAVDSDDAWIAIAEDAEVTLTECC